MANFVKSNRDIPDIDLEVANVSKNKEKKVESNKKTEQKSKKEKSVKKESYFQGVKKELSKVVWPSKKNMIKYSVAAISFIIFFAVFFYIIELIMALLEVGV